MTNAQQLQGRWNQIRGKLKEKWGNLTEDELTMHDGNLDQLIGRIQHKTGEARERVEKFISEIASGVSQAGQAAVDSSRTAGERIRDNWDAVSERMSEPVERAQEFVRDRPGESLLAAFGIGAAFGLLIGFSLRGR